MSMKREFQPTVRRSDELPTCADPRGRSVQMFTIIRFFFKGSGGCGCEAKVLSFFLVK